MQIAAAVSRASRANLIELASTPARRLGMAVAANAMLALSAHIALPLFFTPVPLTLQTFAVLLIGLTLGPSLAFSTGLLYLAEGAMGLPVFSPTGLGGIAQLLGPTGGFLVAMPFAAAVAGFTVRAFRLRSSRFTAALVAGTMATAVSFLLGGLWFQHLLHSSLSGTATFAVVPFLPGEVIKVIAAAGIYASLRRYVRH